MRRAELETARAALIMPDQPVPDDNGSRVCCVPLPAPVSGRVLRVLQESESIVAAGTPLVEIGDPDDLEVVVELLSEDAVRVPPDAPVLIEGWGGGQPLEGRVRRVEPFGFTKVSALGIEEQRVTVVIDFAGDPATRAGLGHGYRVDVQIVEWQGEDVLRVPLSALFRDGDAWAAFAVEDGRARLRRAVLGHIGAMRAEVREGLANGVSVIVHPDDRIMDADASRNGLVEPLDDKSRDVSLHPAAGNLRCAQV